jgi:hypothetical protein
MPDGTIFSVFQSGDVEMAPEKKPLKKTDTSRRYS